MLILTFYDLILRDETEIQLVLFHKNNQSFFASNK
jgi:hypothetical protein